MCESIQTLITCFSGAARVQLRLLGHIQLCSLKSLFYPLIGIQLKLSSLLGLTHTQITFTDNHQLPVCTLFYFAYL